MIENVTLRRGSEAMAAAQARAVADAGNTALVRRRHDPLTVYVWKDANDAYQIQPAGMIEPEWAARIRRIIHQGTKE